MIRRLHVLVFCPIVCSTFAQVAAAPPVELRDGDRVALVGNAFIEREQAEGYIEALLTIRHADRNVTFRNLGWSGDDVWGHSRTRFDPLETGFKTLTEHVRAVKPTVVIVGYGMNESFDGPAGLERFQAGFEQLLAMLADGGARILVVSPIAHEDLGRPLPDPKEHNASLERYVEAMEQITAARGHSFVNLFELLRRRSDVPAHLTDDGIHLTPRGYATVAEPIAAAFGKPLTNGELLDSTSLERRERLRGAIVEKNQLFFHRWRPQNETYLFLFRKHEQGNNAVEIPQFDPLIEAKEAEIAALRTQGKTAAAPPKSTAAPRAAAADAPESPGAVAPEDPETERKSFIVADGLEVNLFAADPMIAKPIQMNFDSRGRLWVVTSPVYPQILPGAKADDKVLVLEDSDGDGRADKSTVFADGLLIPTGIEPIENGAFVANSTELILLKDTDGDGRADERRVLLSGFGTEDTHHILHAFRRGLDGCLYFNQSIYIHSHVETPHGVRRLGGGGIWRFRPETMELETFAYGMCNPWGHDFDRWGQSFAADGAYGEGVIYVIPGATIVGTPTSKREWHGLNPGSPKHCGAEIVSGRHFPDDWQGNFITNDFRANRVCRFVISEEGAGYVSKEMPEVIKAKSVAFRPIDAKMGPDGALYIADWYNPVIQHGEVDFRSPRRNHTNGRIWRITVKGRALVARPKLVEATIPELLDQLKAPESWTRRHAKRVLADRPRTEVLAALGPWLGHLDPTDPELEHHRLEALWLCETLDDPNWGLVASLLEANDPRVRAAATRALRNWRGRIDGVLPLLERRLGDSHPRVRLEAVRAIGDLPGPRMIEIAMTALDHPMDSSLEYALHLTANQLEPAWLPAFESGEVTFGGSLRRLEYALQAVGSARVVRPLVQLIRSGKVPPQREQQVLILVAAYGGPEELDLVLNKAIDLVASDSEGAARLLAALARASRDGKSAPPPGAPRIARLLESAAEPIACEAARLAGAWKLEALRAKLLELAGAKASTSRRREAALEGVACLGGPASIDALSRVAGDEKEAAALRLHAAGLLATLDAARGASAAAGTLAAIRLDDADPSGVFQAFLARRGGADALGSAIAARKLSGDIAKVGIRVASTYPSSAGLVSALRGAGGLTGEATSLDPKAMKDLIESVARAGDPAKGEALFRRKETSCLKCHAIAGAGGQVGPDLSTIGSVAQIDYLIDSILDPNKAVKENYHSMVVVTRDGRILTGIKVRQGPDDLVLRDVEDQEVSIRRDAIQEQSMAGSVMPSGLADSLTSAELRDLVRFLSELGKAGPYAVTRGPVARRWRLIASPTTAVPRDDDPAWAATYSDVAGTLPLADLPRSAAGGAVIARCDVAVTTGGDFKLLLGSTDGLELSVDGKPIAAARETALRLAAGAHSLAFRVDPSKRKDGLRCQLADVPGSGGLAQFVGGK